MNRPSFEDFLQRSLDVLDVEAPGAYSAVCERLGRLSVAISVDAERVSVRCVAGRLRTQNATGREHAEALSSRAALVRLLEGDVELTQAILDDAVVLKGALEDLVAFYDGLLLYFLGAARCPSFPLLLDEFLDSTSTPAEQHGPH